MKNSDQTLHSSQSTHRTEWKEYSIFNKNITAGSLQYLWKTNMHYFVWHPFVACFKWDQNVTNPIKWPRTKLNWFLNINYIPRSQFWMDFFGDLRDSGNLNGSHEHQCLLRFCFRGVLQKGLDECIDLWNKHRIRPSRLASCPGGIPNELYLLPHRYLSS